MLFSILVFGLSFWNVAQVQEPQPEEYETLYYKVEKIFIPVGFDDNDDVEVIVSGQFPNDCWKVEEVEKTRTKAGYSLKMKARKWKAFCADKMSPFWKKVSLGYLKVGNYIITNEEKNEGTLIVRGAKFKTEDDYQYASVDSVKTRYEFNKETGRIEKRFLVLKGEFPNACYQLAKNPPVDLIRESSEGLIEILPVIEYNKALSQNCSTPIEFEEPIAIPENLSGKFMIYLRTDSDKLENSIAKLIHIQSMN